jgi:hypothetical protein
VGAVIPHGKPSSRSVEEYVGEKYTIAASPEDEDLIERESQSAADLEDLCDVVSHDRRSGRETSPEPHAAECGHTQNC